MFTIRFLLALVYLTLPLLMCLVMGFVVLVEEKYESLQRNTEKE